MKLQFHEGEDAYLASDWSVVDTWEAAHGTSSPGSLPQEPFDIAGRVYRATGLKSRRIIGAWRNESGEILEYPTPNIDFISIAFYPDEAAGKGG